LIRVLEPMCFRRSKQAANVVLPAHRRRARVAIGAQCAYHSGSYTSLTVRAGTSKYVGYYLVTYNMLSSLAWGYILVVITMRLVGIATAAYTAAPPHTATSVFARLATNIPVLRTFAPATSQTRLPLIFQRVINRSDKSYAALGLQTAIIQSFAVLEVLHAYLHWRSSRVSTTAVQVVLRLILVSDIAEKCSVNWQSFFYVATAWLWVFTEVMRYAFAATSVQQTPRWLVLLRYVLFIDIYRMNPGSEEFDTRPTIPTVNEDLRWIQTVSSWAFGYYVRAIVFLILCFSAFSIIWNYSH